MRTTNTSSTHNPYTRVLESYEYAKDFYSTSDNSPPAYQDKPTYKVACEAIQNGKGLPSYEESQHNPMKPSSLPIPICYYSK